MCLDDLRDAYKKPDDGHFLSSVWVYVAVEVVVIQQKENNLKMFLIAIALVALLCMCHADEKPECE